MADTITFSPSRRSILQVAALGAAGFAVGCDMRGASAASGPATKTMLGPYVKVGSDNTVTVLLRHIEFGQGVSTGLTTIVAEELDADWTKVAVESAPVERRGIYANPALWALQLTGGSSAIAGSYDLMRKAGATARTMLVSAAAAEWKVPADADSVVEGCSSVTRKAGRPGFGRNFAAAAAKLPVPEEVALKDP